MHLSKELSVIIKHTSGVDIRHGTGTGRRKQNKEKSPMESPITCMEKTNM